MLLTLIAMRSCSKHSTSMQVCMHTRRNVSAYITITTNKHNNTNNNNTRIHTYIHTNIHTYIHAYIHTYMIPIIHNNMYYYYYY